AAPRSPYRHLELCGIALSLPQRSSIQGSAPGNKKLKVFRTTRKREKQPAQTAGGEGYHHGYT
uniref:hypothetical protein n=1 Tax=Gemmiger qucibialis TaxID=2997294 RepID=UPI003FEE87F9